MFLASAITDLLERQPGFGLVRRQAKRTKDRPAAPPLNFYVAKPSCFVVFLRGDLLRRIPLFRPETVKSTVLKASPYRNAHRSPGASRLPLACRERRERVAERRGGRRAGHSFGYPGGCQSRRGRYILIDQRFQMCLEMADGYLQLMVPVITTDQLLHTIRSSTSWQRWGDVRSSVAGLPGAVQILPLRKLVGMFTT